jgi:hypothetical protein
MLFLYCRFIRTADGDVKHLYPKNDDSSFLLIFQFQKLKKVILFHLALSPLPLKKS